MPYFQKHPNYNKAAPFLRDEESHNNEAPWRMKFKIVLQPPRSELWKLLFGQANCRRIGRKYYL